MTLPVSLAPVRWYLPRLNSAVDGLMLGLSIGLGLGVDELAFLRFLIPLSATAFASGLVPATVANGRGLAYRRYVRFRRLAWSDITAITTVQHKDARHVRVETRDGQSVRLPLPSTSQERGRFNADVALLTDYWLACRGPVGSVADLPSPPGGTFLSTR